MSISLLAGCNGWNKEAKDAGEKRFLIETDRYTNEYGQAMQIGYVWGTVVYTNGARGVPLDDWKDVVITPTSQTARTSAMKRYTTGDMSLGFESHAEYSVMINGCGGTNRMLASHSIMIGGHDLTITNEWELVIGGCDSNYVFRVKMETNEFWTLYNLLSRIQR